jgi:type IV pilus assembly protein PilY1
VSQRTPLVFAAANDGMLHAFDASSGAEVYAYLPGALMVSQTDPFTGMSEPFVNLTNPGYGAGSYPHQFYNDGELTIADAYVDLGSGAAWHTILVGTTGRGPARAVYALDVTDPTAITPLWERYAGDSSSLDSNSGYIGEMVGKPVIAQTGDYGTSPAWSVLIGNGYNSPRGVAALLQFDLATGALYVHQTDSQTSNGLAAPVAWRDYPTSGMNDVAYAGDLLGRLWSFPLITVSTSNHGGSSTTSYTPSPSSVGTKLFTAANASGAAQAITAGMLAGLNPKDNSVWVFFGTGKYLTQADVANTSVQSWYGIRVQSSPGGSQITTSNRSSLVQRQIVAEQAGSASPFQLPVRAVTSAPSTSDMSGKNGWFMDLVSPNPNGVNNPTAQGERMVVPDQFQGNLLLGATRIPQPSGANTDPCNPAGGGWIMAVDPFTGTNPSTNFFDTNGDGLINGGDTITVNGQQVPAAGVGFNALPNAPIFVGGDMLVSFDNGTTSNVKTAGSSGGYKRVSWQEMVNP